MGRSGGGFWGVGHGCAPVVVFIGNCGGLLWNIEVQDNDADEEQHLANIASCHKLCFYGGEGNGRAKAVDRSGGLTPP